MSATHDCGCPKNIAMIPIHGLQFGIDADLLQGSGGGGRIRVDADLHLYINGNRIISGDGLSAATAVRTYEEAVEVASHYDGCNRFAIYLHFADLAGGAEYPEVDARGAHHSTFLHIDITGETYLGTKIKSVVAGMYAIIHLRNISTRKMRPAAMGTMRIYGKIGVYAVNGQPEEYALYLSTKCYARIEPEGEVHILGGRYTSIIFANLTSNFMMHGRIIIDAPTTVTQAFAYASGNAILMASSVASIAANAAVTGTRYLATQGGVISTGGSATYFPGTVAGSVSTGGVYC